MPLKSRARESARWLAQSIGVREGAIPRFAVEALGNGCLRSLAEHINAARFYHDVSGIAGWLSSPERRALYALGLVLPGPFLEIGPWAGLSTSCIALGIRDSRTSKRFVTTELNPTLACFRKRGSEIAFHYPPESTELRGTSSETEFETDIKPVLASPGGVLGTLSRTLTSLDLNALVEVIEGDFEQVAPRLAYSFVFCDAMHDPDEIAKNGPALRNFVRPGSILACHDVTRHPDNEMRVRAHIPLINAVVCDSLLIGEVA